MNIIWIVIIVLAVVFALCLFTWYLIFHETSSKISDRIRNNDIQKRYEQYEQNQQQYAQSLESHLQSEVIAERNRLPLAKQRLALAERNRLALEAEDNRALAEAIRLSAIEYRIAKGKGPSTDAY